MSKLQYTNPPEGTGLSQEVEIMHTISKRKDTGGKVRNSKVAKKKSEKKERVWRKEHKRVTKVTNEWGWLKVEERQESTEGKQKRGSLRTAKGVQTVKAHTEKKTKKERRRWPRRGKKLKEAKTKSQHKITTRKRRKKEGNEGKWAEMWTNKKKQLSSLNK